MSAETVYTWAVANMERHTADGIVYIVHHTVVANDGTYSSSAYGSLGFEAPESDPIPFADLTPEIVTGWVKNKFGAEKVAEIEAALQAQIDEQRAPSKASGVPWAS